VTTAVLVATSLRPSVLLGGFQTASASLGADAALLLCAVLYLHGVARLRQRGRQWRATWAASFCAGLVVVFIAVGSGLAAYDDDNFTAHVVQHVLLMMVAAPLLVLGRPLTLILQSAPRRIQGPLARLLRALAGSRTAALLVFVLFFGAMWAYFLTPLYGLSIRHPVLHYGAHVAFLLLGVSYFQLALSPERKARGDRFRQVATLVAGMPVEMYLGFTLHALDHSLGQGTTTASVRAGGAVFWWLTMLVSGFTLAVLIWQWLAEDERLARRHDALVETDLSGRSPTAGYAVQGED
jgi:cytochrome c oxidase assembly factor CtaG